MTNESKAQSGAPMPDFAAFYRALNGRDPFPWQERLARQVEENEAWPGEIGVPTGLGKTSCLDIAVWWLASQAHRRPADRTAPTRIWWVVNRRLLVDSTAEHAERMAQALRKPGAAGGPSVEGVAAIENVADRLRSLASAPTDGPLEVIRLRGGVETRTPSDPSRPAIVLCTLPMFGSRLLFRGYGSSTKMRPIDAAMAGTDSLVLLDEAHLAPHLQSLLAACSECAPGAQPILGVRSRPQVTALTATGDASAASRFDLDERDYAHPVVRRRVGAAKPIEVQSMESGEVGRRLAEATKELLDRAATPASALVFANTPSTARDAHRKLGKLLDTDIAEVMLLTGRSRERESKLIRERILDDANGMAAGREAGAGRDRHLIVVATQTLEVGADIDAEYLVTEACGVRALTQRLGRLNRLGNYRHARGIYLHTPPLRPPRKGSSEEPMWLVYGQEPRAVFERLQAAGGGGTVELCPARVGEVLGEPEDDRDRAPELLFGILWEWMKTTTPPSGEAPVEPYFAGIRPAALSVSVIWRVHLPDVEKLDPAEEGVRLWPRARDEEAVDVPILELREFLGTDEVPLRLSQDGLTVEAVSPRRLRPADTVILSTDRGGLDEFGWNPAVSNGNKVMDVSLLGRGLPLDSDAIGRLCVVTGLGDLLETALGRRKDDEEVSEEERRGAAEGIIERIRKVEETPDGWSENEWNKFVSSLETTVVNPRSEVARIVSRKGDEETRSDELDEMSLTDEVASLEEHGRDVGERARAIADRLGLDAVLAETVETAGRLHDIGKADRRFQRWLDPDGDHPEDLVLAKSDMPRHRWDAARAAARWPRGGRHEALSARLVRRWLDSQPEWGNLLQRDLLLHLVISHHGKGRPLVPPVSDDTASVVSWTVDGSPVEAPADLSVVDWSQPRRFRSLNGQFGPWGLALLETIVRLADHAVSGRARKEGH